ncbi:recombination mediator RecR [Helicobacter winghamensis]|uniref:Recombination protein RecR n=1 Tax=Helicobacter winghamensis TaxID=157268 RepID=A0A2N3PI18_9HELI|nr:recombination mediator RecR [Helicobacter winghamensis]EEO26143.1 recombination protein RecR [Helicobacter winghamensis ATCC BAA-430]PKT75718.1 recombination protein RecR [Helicobacter winghamensis]PKT75927.1 recombination protein RecR [Helicobacter winghamensis]PKT76164.1 recombination protein RecR [Helicobacter winghamensis]PKT80310.1 recombination protein RecR [Helicobacter winghamensis]
MKSYPESFAKLVESLERIPSVGRKSAMRLAYFLAFEDKFSALQVAHNIECCVQELRTCEECGGITNQAVCEICLDATRNNGELCIVANPREIFLLEESGEFFGKYFVLDSLDKLNLEQLERSVTKFGITEIIFAFSPSLGSDSIMLYLEDKLENFGLRFTKIAQGIPTGVSLENVDQLSIIRALQSRVKI